MKEKIDFTVAWIKVLYPVFIISLFLLDYLLFVDFFIFEKGLFFSIFERIDVVSISFIVLLLLLPFFFLFLYLYSSIFAYEEYKSRYSNDKKQKEEQKVKDGLVWI